MKKITLLIALMITSLGFAQPTTSAPVPTKNATDVVSIYGGSYTSIATNLNPGWGQSGTVNPTYNPGDGNLCMAYLNFNYQGTNITTTNLSAMEYLHVDVWTNKAPSNFILQVSPINVSGPVEMLVTINHVQGQWYSVDIPKSAFTGMTWNSVKEIKFAANGAGSTPPGDIYLDNIYFWKTPPPAGTPVIGPLTVPAKKVGDAPFNLTAPTSDSPGAFSYTSGNTSVATISGNTVTIVGAGTSVITAVQAASPPYLSGSVTANLVVEFLPATPAPTPNTPNAQVFKIYGDTGGFTNNWAPDYSFGGFAGKPDLDPTAGINEAIKMDFSSQGYGEGLDPNLPRKDVSAYGYLNFSYYVQSGAANAGSLGHQFYFDLISRIGATNTEAFYGFGPTITSVGTPSEHVKKVIVFDSWQTVSIPLSDFVGFSPANFFQFKIGSSSDLRTKVAFLDNIYFSVNPGTTLGTEKFETSSVKMYPNPVKNTLTIEANSEIQRVSVYNILGQEVLKASPKSNTATLQTNELQKGVYMVTTEIDGKMSTSKIIKE